MIPHALRTGPEPMLTRRLMLLSATAMLAVMGLPPLPAWAQTPEQATAFIEQTAKELVDVVNGPGTLAEKRAKLQVIVDRAVDVNEVARFCLGRFWRTASPQQQKEYLDLFHRVLMINITGKVGEYQGVSFVMGRTSPREGAMAVSTTVNRPGNAPSSQS